MPEIIIKGPFHGVHFLLQDSKQYQKAFNDEISK